MKIHIGIVSCAIALHASDSPICVTPRPDLDAWNPVTGLLDFRLASYFAGACSAAEPPYPIRAAALRPVRGAL